MWCCITPERQEKTERIMRALAAGTGGTVYFGAPPDKEVFAVWGHKWLAETIVPNAHAEGRPWWFIDNGYWRSARGTENGYYSITYRGFWPMLLDRPDMNRLPVKPAPWREGRDGYVLLALPGMSYGAILGFDMPAWSKHMQTKIRKSTRRRVVIRDKTSRRPLAADLAGASVVVTHSSKVAVDAVMAGVPAIVAPTNPAAPVAGTDLEMIEDPPRPDRERWWASLMCQQFTLKEMRSGTANYWMDAVKEQADAKSAIYPTFRLEAEAIGDARLQGGIRAPGDDAVCAGCHCQGACRRRRPQETQEAGR
ncbi:hypothetical protein ABIA24_001802 [Sinorhizobium fredii]